jgi:hypothetical protein
MFLIGRPSVGAQVLALYGAANGMVLVLDVLAVVGGARLRNGLLSAQRAELFFPIGGIAMLACGVYVLAHSSLAR